MQSKLAVTKKYFESPCRVDTDQMGLYVGSACCSPAEQVNLIITDIFLDEFSEPTVFSQSGGRDDDEDTASN